MNASSMHHQLSYSGYPTQHHRLTDGVLSEICAGTSLCPMLYQEITGSSWTIDGLDFSQIGAMSETVAELLKAAEHMQIRLFFLIDTDDDSGGRSEEDWKLFDWLLSLGCQHLAYSDHASSELVGVDHQPNHEDEWQIRQREKPRVGLIKTLWRILFRRF